MAILDIGGATLKALDYLRQKEQEEYQRQMAERQMGLQTQQFNTQTLLDLARMKAEEERANRQIQAQQDIEQQRNMAQLQDKLINDDELTQIFAMHNTPQLQTEAEQQVRNLLATQLPNATPDTINSIIEFHKLKAKAMSEDNTIVNPLVYVQNSFKNWYDISPDFGGAVATNLGNVLQKRGLPPTLGNMTNVLAEAFQYIKNPKMQPPDEIKPLVDSYDDFSSNALSQLNTNNLMKGGVANKYFAVNFLSTEQLADLFSKGLSQDSQAEIAKNIEKMRSNLEAEQREKLKALNTKTKLAIGNYNLQVAQTNNLIAWRDALKRIMEKNLNLRALEQIQNNQFATTQMLIMANNLTSYIPLLNDAIEKAQDEKSALESILNDKNNKMKDSERIKMQQEVKRRQSVIDSSEQLKNQIMENGDWITRLAKNRAAALMPDITGYGGYPQVAQPIPIVPQQGWAPAPPTNQYQQPYAVPVAPVAPVAPATKAAPTKAAPATKAAPLTPATENIWTNSAVQYLNKHPNMPPDKLAQSVRIAATKRTAAHPAFNMTQADAIRIAKNAYKIWQQQQSKSKTPSKAPNRTPSKAPSKTPSKSTNGGW